MIRKAKAISLIALLGFLPGCKSIKGYVSTSCVSDYVSSSGIIVKGQVQQDFVSVKTNRVSGFVWQNYSFDEKATNDLDFGVHHLTPLSDRVSLRAGFERWTYPSGTFGDHDNILKAGINYDSLANFDLDVTHILPHRGNPAGTRYYGKIKKTLPIFEKGDLKVSVTLSLASAVLNKYWGRTGHSHITPAVSFAIQKGKFDMSFFVNKQFGLIERIEKDHVWGGISAGFGF